MKRVIVSGGGTGGHIFPALSIANALKRLQPDIEILFVGAEGKASTRTKRCRRKTRRCFTWPTATVHWHWC